MGIPSTESQILSEKFKSSLKPHQKRALSEVFHASEEEFAEFVEATGYEISDLSGTTTQAKGLQLLIRALRDDNLEILVSEAVKRFPQASEPTSLASRIYPSALYLLDRSIEKFIKESSGTNNIQRSEPEALLRLQIETKNLREKINQLEKDKTFPEKAEKIIEDIESAATRIDNESADLTARLILPPPELRNLRMIPEHIFLRLEEYREDENLAYLLVGSAVGVIFSVVANWLTATPIKITPPSILLFILSAVALLFSYLWKRKIDARKFLATQSLLDWSTDKDKH